MTPQPTVAPTADPSAAVPSPSPLPSVAPTVGATVAPSATPAPSDGGAVVVPTAAADPTGTPGPIPAGPASEIDPFAGRLVLPIALIVALVLAGFVLANVKGRAPRKALAGASGSGAASAAGAAGLDAGDAADLEPELYSALVDPVGPSFEPVPSADHGAGTWGNEQVEARED